ncbi:MAG: CDP-alcohol phosphatidyltransferase family protein [Anaerolineales bacterium]|nr:CDP-alcohol phosphatidyltransferase family protein [Anaerolineales bacterium]
MTATNVNKKISFSDRARLLFKGILDPIGNFLNGLGIAPNTITLFGLLGTTVGAYVISQGQMTAGGFILLAFVLVDTVDGTMARLRGEPSDFGGFVDSVSDRYAELVTFGALIYYFLTQEHYAGVAASYLAAAGSVLVSYVRARAEGLGFNASVGMLTRFERYLVLIPLLVFNQPFWAAAIVAVLANLTALQRIYHVRAQGRQRIKESQNR